MNVTGKLRGQISKENICVAVRNSTKKRLKPLLAYPEALPGAEGGIRSGLFLDIRGCPSCGFSRDFTFVVVFDCSLMVVGVPVNFPVSFGIP